MTPTKWHRSSPVSIIYHLLIIAKSVLNLWPALAGMAFLERGREQILSYGLPSLAILLVVIALLNYWFFQFSFDAEKIQLRSGILHRKRLTLNFDRVQEANLQQSLYFRPFNLWTLGLESAGSSAQEIKIPGIDLSLAETIKSYHLAVKSNAMPQQALPAEPLATLSDETAGILPPVSAPVYQLRLGLVELLRYGLMHNRLIYVLFVFPAVISQYPDIWLRLGKAVGIPSVGDYLSDYFQQSLAAGLLVTLSVAGIGVIVLYALSVLLAVVKYWDYELTVEDERLHYRAGLLNKVQRSFKQHKLQSVEVSQSLTGRFLKRYSMRLQQTNERTHSTDLLADGFTIPVLSVTELDALKALLDIDTVDWQRPNPLRIVWRTLGLGIPLTLLLLGLMLAGKPVAASALLLPIPLLGLLFTGYWYRYGYAFTAHWMARRQGLFGCRYTYVPCTKVQMMDLRQGPLLRLHGVSTLLVWNGAGVQRFEFISSAVLLQAKARIGSLVSHSRAR